ncbi:hypothetical protein QUA46_27525 [Microcoleus sp. MON2_D6]|uniref:hypothetical protein n=1 Tax=unclassified Microcoleus TaxID=2642155 RepID=UPI002FCF8D35
MNRFNLELVLENLGSSKIDKQVPAVEQAAEIIDALAAKAVGALKKGPHRLLVAERLSRLGSRAIPHLEKLFTVSNDSETKILAALVLLGLGSSSGVPILLDAIVEDNIYHLMAAHHLALEGIKEVIEPIIKRLLKTEITEVDSITSLLTSLEEIGGNIPLELNLRLDSPDAPLGIRFALWKLRTNHTGVCDINEFKKMFVSQNHPSE